MRQRTRCGCFRGKTPRSCVPRTRRSIQTRDRLVTPASTKKLSCSDSGRSQTTARRKSIAPRSRSVLLSSPPFPARSFPCWFLLPAYCDCALVEFSANLLENENDQARKEDKRPQADKDHLVPHRGIAFPKLALEGNADSDPHYGNQRESPLRHVSTILLFLVFERLPRLEQRTHAARPGYSKTSPSRLHH